MEARASRACANVNSQELLERVRSAPPDFFERLIVNSTLACWRSLAARSCDAGEKGNDNMKRTSGGVLTRGALRDTVYRCCRGLSRAAAREVVEAFLEEISEALVRGEPVQLRRFGRFAVRAKRGRLGRNPRTMVEATILPRRVISFKPSPMLIARINGQSVPNMDEDRTYSNSFNNDFEPLA